MVRYGGEVMVGQSAEDQERLHRVALKLEAVDDLMDRRITLAEAVERFEALDAAPEALSNMRASLAGNTDTERALNQVLSVRPGSGRLRTPSTSTRHWPDWKRRRVDPGPDRRSQLIRTDPTRTSR